jgi:hypothetical protein
MLFEYSQSWGSHYLARQLIWSLHSLNCQKCVPFIEPKEITAMTIASSHRSWLCQLDLCKIPRFFILLEKSLKWQYECSHAITLWKQSQHLRDVTRRRPSDKEKAQWQGEVARVRWSLWLPCKFIGINGLENTMSFPFADLYNAFRSHSTTSSTKR